MEEVFIFRKGSGAWKHFGMGKLFGGNRLILEDALPSSLAEFYIGRQIETDEGWEMQLQRFVQKNAIEHVAQSDWEIEIQEDILHFPEDRYDVQGNVIVLLEEE